MVTVPNPNTLPHACPVSIVSLKLGSCCSFGPVVAAAGGTPAPERRPRALVCGSRRPAALVTRRPSASSGKADAFCQASASVRELGACGSRRRRSALAPRRAGKLQPADLSSLVRCRAAASVPPCNTLCKFWLGWQRRAARHAPLCTDGSAVHHLLRRRWSGAAWPSAAHAPSSSCSASAVRPAMPAPPARLPAAANRRAACGRPPHAPIACGSRVAYLSQAMPTLPSGTFPCGRPPAHPAVPSTAKPILAISHPLSCPPALCAAEEHARAPLLQDGAGGAVRFCQHVVGTGGVGRTGGRAGRRAGGQAGGVRAGEPAATHWRCPPPAHTPAVHQTGACGGVRGAAPLVPCVPCKTTPTHRPQPCRRARRVGHGDRRRGWHADPTRQPRAGTALPRAAAQHQQHQRKRKRACGGSLADAAARAAPRRRQRRQRQRWRRHAAPAQRRSGRAAAVGGGAASGGGRGCCRGQRRSRLLAHGPAWGTRASLGGLLQLHSGESAACTTCGGGGGTRSVRGWARSVLGGRRTRLVPPPGAPPCPAPLPPQAAPA